MSKEHISSELPYNCGGCGYRCSSHKQIIDHFYMDHNGGVLVQCPYCLKSMSLYTNGRIVVQNMNFFVQHLNKHQKKINCKKCSKCVLAFTQKDFPKEHMKLHETLRFDPLLEKWPVPKANAIMVPKSCYDEDDDDEKELDISNLEIEVPSHLKCKECTESLASAQHFP